VIIIVFPEGTTPDDFEEIDFNRRQPDPTTPGGPDRTAPPVPNVPTSRLVPMSDDDGIFFLEFDLEDEEVPLGEWRFDDVWVFSGGDAFIYNEQQPNLGEVTVSTLPRTGGTTDNTAYLLMLIGIPLGCFGLTMMEFIRNGKSRRRQQWRS
jgi:hypothetical protein